MAETERRKLRLPTSEEWNYNKGTVSLTTKEGSITGTLPELRNLDLDAIDLRKYQLPGGKAHL